VRALQRDWAGGRLQRFAELVHGEIFSDMLDAAAHLHSGGYKDPAAVMAGGVLEQHVRNLCSKNSVSTATDKNGDVVSRKLDALNADLQKAGAYDKTVQK